MAVPAAQFPMQPALGTVGSLATMVKWKFTRKRTNCLIHRYHAPEIKNRQQKRRIQICSNCMGVAYAVNHFTRRTNYKLLPGASCKKIGRAGSCFGKMTIEVPKTPSCETLQTWRDGVWGTPPQSIRASGGPSQAPPAGSGAEPRKFTDFLRFDLYIVLTI